MVDVLRSKTLAIAGTGAVAVGAVGVAAGSWSGRMDLRTGVIPWALGALVVGVALILLGSYWGGIGRPPRLVRWGSILALAGLGVAGAFFIGTGILEAADSDLLSAGETLLSSLATLVVSVSTLIFLPGGLLAVGVAVLIDKDLSVPLRALPLAATLAFALGPVLIAMLPESDERTVFIAWPLVLGAAWTAYGLLVTTELTRQRGRFSAAE